MKKAIVLLIFLLLIFIGFTITENSDVNKYDNFSLYDYNKKLNSLEDLSTKKSIVLIFVSTQCPVSNAYNFRISSLFNK